MNMINLKRNLWKFIVEWNKFFVFVAIVPEMVERIYVNMDQWTIREREWYEREATS